MLLQQNIPMHQILSKSLEFCTRYYKTFWCFFPDTMYRLAVTACVVRRFEVSHRLPSVRRLSLSGWNF